MAVVALSRFVIVQDEALSRPAEEEAIFEGVLRAADRLRDQPENKFRDRAVVIVSLAVEDPSCSPHMT